MCAAHLKKLGSCGRARCGVERRENTSGARTETGLDGANLERVSVERHWPVLAAVERLRLFLDKG
jgi:hypothetical protein